MTGAASEVAYLSRALKAPRIPDAARTLAAKARDESWDYEAYLAAVLTEEVTSRESHGGQARVKRARFPQVKTLDDFDFSFQRSVKRTQVAHLAQLDFLAEAKNVVFSGPPGTGKSHFVEALGHGAIDAGLKVSWFTLETLTQTINRSKVDASTAKVVQKICRADLIVVDDIGMLPAGQAEAEALYRVADAAYERRSLAVTSNIHPAGFDTLMPKALAGPTVDRLLHHGHVVVTEGDSQRLAEALSGKGVVPLA